MGTYHLRLVSDMFPFAFPYGNLWLTTRKWYVSYCVSLWELITYDS